MSLDPSSLLILDRLLRFQIGAQRCSTFVLFLIRLIRVIRGKNPVWECWSVSFADLIPLTRPFLKPHYMVFLFKGDKAAFVLFPVGGMHEVPRAFNRASYYICNVATGKALDRGEFAFPEDSPCSSRVGGCWLP